MKDSVAICLMGPTASGKTALALDIAKYYPCEIISVDSALVYRGMDIGTAKPSAEELALVPHHLIDTLDPYEAYSAADFRRDALRLIGEIRARGKVPLLVGGTMLYFRVLQQGIAALPSADAQVRAAIDREAAERGWPALHEELTRVDPVTAAKIHPQHSQRIQRALEVFRITGTPMSQLHSESKLAGKKSDETDSIRWVQLAVAPRERKVLHERIARRFDIMLAKGFVDEVRALMRRGDLNADLPSMRAVGYRQVWDHLAGQTAYAEMVEKGIIATRQLAKRQLTWLRSWRDLCWFHTDAAQRVVDDESGPDFSVEINPSLTQSVLKYLERISI